MSILNIIKLRLGLGPAAENHHFDGSVPNQLSLRRGTPEAPGTELIKALNGILSFPNQGQSLAPNGYVKLPGGLIIQWGYGITDPGGGSQVNFPIRFPNACTGQVATAISNVAQNLTCLFSGIAPEGSFLWITNLAGAQVQTGFTWIAIGY